jgi:two-component system sensor histidine kinase BaeS
VRNRLLWKLLGIHIPVIALVIGVMWLAIDYLAADYFMVLMDKYDISPTETQEMFLDAVHRYLVWASLAAVALAGVSSFLLTRKVLQPLSRMADVTRAVAAGNYRARAPVDSGDEIGQLGDAFNRMANSLERVEQLRKAMVADVAHELRTPLTNVRGYLEALSDGVLSPSPETFAILQQEILRLVRLAEDLLQLAKADAARAHLQRQAVSLPALVDEVLDPYRLRFRDKGITAQVQVAPGAERVSADRDRLAQMVGNLAENAWQYTVPGGAVTVYVERVADGIRLTVANTGDGITAEDLPFVFERFYRADKSRSRELGGAGIGLAIVKELAEAHGGSVGATSSAGETRVWFTLPA